MSYIQVFSTREFNQGYKQSSTSREQQKKYLITHIFYHKAMHLSKKTIPLAPDIQNAIFFCLSFFASLMLCNVWNALHFQRNRREMPESFLYTCFTRKMSLNFKGQVLKFNLMNNKKIL